MTSLNVLLFSKRSPSRLFTIVNDDNVVGYTLVYYSRDLQRLLWDGEVERVRKRGAQRRTWLKDILEWTKMNYNDCIRSAMDRRRWRLVVANLKNETTS